MKQFTRSLVSAAYWDGPRGHISQFSGLFWSEWSKSCPFSLYNTSVVEIHRKTWKTGCEQRGRWKKLVLLENDWEYNLVPGQNQDFCADRLLCNNHNCIGGHSRSVCTNSAIPIKTTLQGELFYCHARLIFPLSSPRRMTRMITWHAIPLFVNLTLLHRKQYAIRYFFSGKGEKKNASFSPLLLNKKGRRTAWSRVYGAPNVKILFRQFFLLFLCYIQELSRDL